MNNIIYLNMASSTELTLNSCFLLDFLLDDFGSSIVNESLLIDSSSLLEPKPGRSLIQKNEVEWDAVSHVMSSSLLDG